MRPRRSAATTPRHKLTVTLVDRIILPQHDHGVDWGVDRVVVLKRGDEELWWQPGHNAWVDRMTPSGYYATELYLRDPDDSCGGRSLHEGGRLTPALLLEHRKEIDRVFGRGVARLAAKLLPQAKREKKTIVVDA